MQFQDLQPPVLELAPSVSLFRVQLTRARATSVHLNGLLLAPAGLLAGRFCLADEITAYLADSPETALYESLFRREVVACSWAQLRQRSLVEFSSHAVLRLADLRGLAEPYPVLQAQRIALTQAFSQQCRNQALDGVLYGSAQHPQHACVCLYASGARQLHKTHSTPLVQPNSQRLLSVVVDAARRSGVPLLADQD